MGVQEWVPKSKPKYEIMHSLTTPRKGPLILENQIWGRLGELVCEQHLLDLTCDLLAFWGSNGRPYNGLLRTQLTNKEVATSADEFSWM